MAIYDIDGDGDNDIVSALAARQYGLAWFEQRPDETPEFIAHEILPSSASADNVSQLHALVAVDINNDGLLDIVTGKRYYAHPSRSPDPGSDDPAKLLWFELKREAGTASFTPHTIHEDSGAGCNFAARDLNNDGKRDLHDEQAWDASTRAGLRPIEAAQPRLHCKAQLGPCRVCRRPSTR